MVCRPRPASWITVSHLAGRNRRRRLGTRRDPVVGGGLVERHGKLRQDLENIDGGVGGLGHERAPSGRWSAVPDSRSTRSRVATQRRCGAHGPSFLWAAASHIIRPCAVCPTLRSTSARPAACAPRWRHERRPSAWSPSTTRPRAAVTFGATCRSSWVAARAGLRRRRGADRARRPRHRSGQGGRRGGRRRDLRDRRRRHRQRGRQRHGRQRRAAGRHPHRHGQRAGASSSASRSIRPTPAAWRRPATSSRSTWAWPATATSRSWPAPASTRPSSRR